MCDAEDASGQGAGLEGTEPAACDGGEGSQHDGPAENEAHRREALQWLRSKPLTRLIVIRQVMEPLRQLLQAQLVLGSAVWANNQDAFAAVALAEGAVGEGRAFPIVEAAVGRLELRFSTQAQCLMHEERLWNHLIPLADLNIRMRHLAFRLLSTAEALVHEGLGVPHASFPFRLFRLLAGAPLEEVMALPSCCHDPWTAGFVARHGLAGAAQPSAEALAELRLVACLTQVDISGIEATHASVRRRLMSRVQSRPLSLKELSAEFLLDRTRRQGVPWAAPETAGASALVAPAPARSVKASSKAGPWRAFVREASLGQKGLQDSTELSRRYHALPEQELARLRAVGAAGKQTQRGARGSSFGLRTRDVHREQSRRLRHAAIADTGGVVATRLPEDSGSRCDMALRHAMRVSAGRQGMPDLLSVARAFLHGMQTTSAATLQQAHAELQQWRAGPGAEEFKALLQLLPRLQGFTAALEPRPASSGTWLAVRHPVDATVATYGAIARAARKSTMGKALEDHWAELHRPILHAKSEPIIDPARPPERSCWEVGRCICDEHGRKVARFRREFYRIMKSTFPPKSGPRAELMSRMVVARLMPPEAGAPCDGESDDDPWASVAAEAFGQDIVASDARERFMHVSWLALSPFAAHFKPLSLVSEETRDGVREYSFEASAAQAQLTS